MRRRDPDGVVADREDRRPDVGGAGVEKRVELRRRPRPRRRRWRHRRGRRRRRGRGSAGSWAAGRRSRTGGRRLRGPRRRRRARPRETGDDPRRGAPASRPPCRYRRDVHLDRQGVAHPQDRALGDGAGHPQQAWRQGGDEHLDRLRQRLRRARPAASARRRQRRPARRAAGRRRSRRTPRCAGRRGVRQPVHALDDRSCDGPMPSVKPGRPMVKATDAARFAAAPKARHRSGGLPCRARSSTSRGRPSRSPRAGRQRPRSGTRAREPLGLGLLSLLDHPLDGPAAAGKPMRIGGTYQWPGRWHNGRGPSSAREARWASRSWSVDLPAG